MLNKMVSRLIPTAPVLAPASTPAPAAPAPTPAPGTVQQMVQNIQGKKPKDGTQRSRAEELMKIINSQNIAKDFLSFYT